MHSIRFFRNKPQHAQVIKCWINDETEQTFAVCEVCCTKEHLAPIKMTRSFEGISLLSASVKFSAGIFKYKLAPLYSCHRPSILYHRSYTTGLPNPNHNLSWGEGGGNEHHSKPDYHRAKFTGTDNDSYEQDSHQQTRVHVMYHCIKNAYLWLILIHLM